MFNRYLNNHRQERIDVAAKESITQITIGSNIGIPGAFLNQGIWTIGRQARPNLVDMRFLVVPLYYAVESGCNAVAVLPYSILRFWSKQGGCNFDRLQESLDAWQDQGVLYYKWVRGAKTPMIVQFNPEFLDLPKLYIPLQTYFLTPLQARLYEFMFGKLKNREQFPIGLPKLVKYLSLSCGYAAAYYKIKKALPAIDFLAGVTEKEGRRGKDRVLIFHKQVELEEVTEVQAGSTQTIDMPVIDPGAIATDEVAAKVETQPQEVITNEEIVEMLPQQALPGEERPGQGTESEQVSIVEAAMAQSVGIDLAPTYPPPLPDPPPGRINLNNPAFAALKEQYNQEEKDQSADKEVVEKYPVSPINIADYREDDQRLQNYRKEKNIDYPEVASLKSALAGRSDFPDRPRPKPQGSWTQDLADKWLQDWHCKEEHSPEIGKVPTNPQHYKELIAALPQKYQEAEVFIQKSWCSQEPDGPDKITAALRYMFAKVVPQHKENHSFRFLHELTKCVGKGWGHDDLMAAREAERRIEEDKAAEAAKREQERAIEQKRKQEKEAGVAQIEEFMQAIIDLPTEQKELYWQQAEEKAPVILDKKHLPAVRLEYGRLCWEAINVQKNGDGFARGVLQQRVILQGLEKPC
jgi:hypothetical protein